MFNRLHGESLSCLNDQLESLLVTMRWIFNRVKSNSYNSSEFVYHFFGLHLFKKTLLCIISLLDSFLIANFPVKDCRDKLCVLKKHTSPSEEQLLMQYFPVPGRWEGVGGRVAGGHFPQAQDKGEGRLTGFHQHTL